MNIKKLVPCTEENLNKLTTLIVNKTLYELIKQIEESTNTILIPDKFVDEREKTIIFNDIIVINVEVLKNIVFTDIVVGFSDYLNGPKGNNKALKLVLKLESLFKAARNYRGRFDDNQNVPEIINFCIQRLLAITNIDLNIKDVFNTTLVLSGSNTKVALNQGGINSWGTMFPKEYLGSRADFVVDVRTMVPFSTSYVQGPTNQNISDRTIEYTKEYNRLNTIMYTKLMNACYYTAIGGLEIVDSDILEEIEAIKKFEDSNPTEEAYDFCNKIDKNINALQTTIKQLSGVKSAVLSASSHMNKINIANNVDDNKIELKNYLLNKIDLATIAKYKTEVNEAIAETFVENTYFKQIKKQFSLSEKEKKAKKSKEAVPNWMDYINTARMNNINASSFIMGADGLDGFEDTRRRPSRRHSDRAIQLLENTPEYGILPVAFNNIIAEFIEDYIVGNRDFRILGLSAEHFTMIVVRAAIEVRQQQLGHRMSPTSEEQNRTIILNYIRDIYGGNFHRITSTIESLDRSLTPRNQVNAAIPNTQPVDESALDDEAAPMDGIEIQMTEQELQAEIDAHSQLDLERREAQARANLDSMINDFI
jgi:hypothetical protein